MVGLPTKAFVEVVPGAVASTMQSWSSPCCLPLLSSRLQGGVQDPGGGRGRDEDSYQTGGTRWGGGREKQSISMEEDADELPTPVTISVLSLSLSLSLSLALCTALTPKAKRKHVSYQWLISIIYPLCFWLSYDSLTLISHSHLDPAWLCV